MIEKNKGNLCHFCLFVDFFFINLNKNITYSSSSSVVLTNLCKYDNNNNKKNESIKKNH